MGISMNMGLKATLLRQLTRCWLIASLLIPDGVRKAVGRQIASKSMNLP